MEPNNSTYTEMYNGKLIFPPYDTPLIDYDPRYYAGDLGFYITATHKLAQDKPTVTLSVPIARLGLDEIPAHAAARTSCMNELPPKGWTACGPPISPPASASWTCRAKASSSP